MPGPYYLNGSQPLQPAQVSYEKFDLTADLTLTWPFSFLASSNVVAGQMDVNTQLLPPFTITLPDATEAAPGTSFIFNNIGLSSFYVGTALAGATFTVPSGVAYKFTLTDNSTVDGTYGLLALGANTSGADANALAGLGLISLPSLSAPFPNVLNTNYAPISVTSDYTISLQNRASFIVIPSGGSLLNLTLHPVSGGAVPAGFYFSVTNQGLFPITINAAPGTINGTTTVTLAVNESQTLVSNGNDVWYTLGGSTAFNAQVTELVLDVTGLGATITLSDPQSANQIIIFKGTLGQNTLVKFPNQTNQWTISNQTTGAFTLSIVDTNGNNTYLLAPQSRNIYFMSSDYSTMYNTTYLPTDFVLPNGTASAPSLSFANDQTTGLFSGSAGTIDFAIGGVNRGYMDSTTLAYGGVADVNELIVNPGTAAAPSISFGTDQTTGLSASTGNINASASGVNQLTINSSGLSVRAGTAAAPTVSFGSDQTTGFYSTGAGNINASVGGVNQLTINSSGLSLANPLPIASGGTGGITKAAAFDNLSPTTAIGDMISRASTGNVALPISATLGEMLLSTLVSGNNQPAWGGYGIIQIKYIFDTVAQTGAAGAPLASQQTPILNIQNANSMVLLISNCSFALTGASTEQANCALVLRAGASTSFFINLTVPPVSSTSDCYSDSNFNIVGPFSVGTQVRANLSVSPTSAGTAYLNTTPSIQRTGQGSFIAVIELGGF